MSNWFDGIAKRAARRTPDDSTSVESSAVDDAGLSRRQVLARGAVLTGAAWTAPALLAARPAFAGASICVGNRRNPFFKLCDDGTTETCCPDTTDECFIINGNPVCQTPLGVACGNRGNGQCAGNTARCDQAASDRTQLNGICGGSGAECGNGEVCLYNNCSTIDDRCGGEGAPCSGDIECADRDPNDTNPLFCDFSRPPNPAVPGETGTCRLVVPV